MPLGCKPFGEQIRLVPGALAVEKTIQAELVASLPLRVPISEVELLQRRERDPAHLPKVGQLAAVPLRDRLDRWRILNLCDDPELTLHHLLEESLQRDRFDERLLVER